MPSKRPAVVDYWYSAHPARWLLAPLSGLFRCLVKARRWGYRYGLLRTRVLPVPVLVVGNLALGGTGKTPLVIWLAQFLQRQGYRPGLVSRGYGGRAPHYPQRVNGRSDPALVGDEAIVLVRRTACPTVVGPNRAAAAQALLAHSDCNVLLSDDGLQHYALGRNMEILVVDGVRRFGNGHCLPAGPLREPLNRCRTVDLAVSTGGRVREREFAMQLQLRAACNLQSGMLSSLTALRHTPVHAVAGMGHPKRFFMQLQAQGLSVYEHPFPDHHCFQPGDLAFGDSLPVLMTEKDAVKCSYFARDNYWCVPADSRLPDSFGRQVLRLLRQVNKSVG